MACFPSWMKLLFQVSSLSEGMTTCTMLTKLLCSADLDGKLYDAYVAYPQSQTAGFSEEIEKFALHTLPQVLEESWGYKVFIEGRDGLLGQCKDPTG